MMKMMVGEDNDTVGVVTTITKMTVGEDDTQDEGYSKLTL